MNDKGLLYILVGYKIVEDQLIRGRGWFGKDQQVSYVNELNISKFGPQLYDYTQGGQLAMRRRVNEMIEDRSRYLFMCKSLSDYGYVIKKK